MSIFSAFSFEIGSFYKFKNNRGVEALGLLQDISCGDNSYVGSIATFKIIFVGGKSTTIPCEISLDLYSFYHQASFYLNSELFIATSKPIHHQELIKKFGKFINGGIYNLHSPESSKEIEIKVYSTFNDSFIKFIELDSNKSIMKNISTDKNLGEYFIHTVNGEDYICSVKDLIG